MKKITGPKTTRNRVENTNTQTKKNANKAREKLPKKIKGEVRTIEQPKVGIDVDMQAFIERRRKINAAKYHTDQQEQALRQLSQKPNSKI